MYRAAVFPLNFTKLLYTLNLKNWRRIHKWIFREKNLNKGFLDESVSNNKDVVSEQFWKFILSFGSFSTRLSKVNDNGCWLPPSTTVVSMKTCLVVMPS